MSTINQLGKSLKQHYWTHNKKMIFPIQWERKKGLYSSTVRLNYVDKLNKEPAEFIRTKMFKVDDINIFVTSFVLFGQLEAMSLGTFELNDH